MLFRIITLLCYACCILIPAKAQPLTGNCYPAIAQVDLDINNVRARILNAGDMWWNLSQAQYEVPKGSGIKAVFAGSIWMGGLDAMGLLHTAAMTYRQTGYDFWPGPMDTVNVTTELSQCNKYDRIYKLNRGDVESFISNRNTPGYVIPDDIRNWPGNGNTAIGQPKYLAPFNDVDGDGIYNPANGDYPGFAINRSQNCTGDLLGDQCLWWVMNDKGNVHGETGGRALGFEIRAQAFAFKTNDEINDATFYQWQLINRSSETYSKMYFGNYVDHDLGYFGDDFMGCDVSRSMGIGYNGDLIDGNNPQGAPGEYGSHPPAIGFDILQGPVAMPGDFKDNDRDGIIDEPGERVNMSNFRYWDGDFDIAGNPETDFHFYWYMQNLYKDGTTPITYGGNGNSGTIPCTFMFPDDTDPQGFGTGGFSMPRWNEYESGNTPSDRRMLSSAGPFNMAPGEVQTITTAMLWARDTNEVYDTLYPMPSVAKLKQVSDKAQLLFDNCFQLPCSTSAAPEIFATETVPGTFLFYTTGNWNNYQWSFGDGTLSGHASSVHVYSYDGPYTVCLKVSNACTTFTVCKTVMSSRFPQECGPDIMRIEGKGNGKQHLELTLASIDSIFASPQHRVLHPVYESCNAPVKIVVEDFLNLKEGYFRLAFTDTSMNAGWKLYAIGETDTIYSDSVIASGNRQHIPQWGIAVELQQVALPGYDRNADRNGFLDASLTFADPQKNWLDAVADVDYFIDENWIRSGVQDAAGQGCIIYTADKVGDDDEKLEKILGGTWAPFILGAQMDFLNCYSGVTPGGNAGFTIIHQFNKLENLAGVDIVFTPDTEKWTRCMVIETGDAIGLNEDQQLPFHPRAAASVNKQGQPDGSGTTGMGWFPGYAINVETGERLNMMFGEDSGQPGHNGRDMLWNPTADTLNPVDGTRWWGGKHFIYVMGHNGDGVFTNYTTSDLIGQLKDVPRYDSCKAIYKIFTSPGAFGSYLSVREIYNDAMWVNIPLLRAGHSLLESEAKVRLRMQSPYRKFVTNTTPENNNNPLYQFRISRYGFDCNIYNAGVSLFPNPMHDGSWLWFTNTDGLAHELELYDVAGKLVRQYANITDDHFFIPREGLRSGGYLFRLRNANGVVHTGRMIVY